MPIEARRKDEDERSGHDKATRRPRSAGASNAVARDACILGMAGEGQRESASARAALETAGRLDQALVVGVLLP